MKKVLNPKDQGSSKKVLNSKEEGSSKKVLIFYSTTGGGHLRGAEALAEEISRRKGYKVVLSDGLYKFSWGPKAHPAFMFFLLSHYLLPLYDTGYKLTDNRVGLRFLRKGIKLAWSKQLQKIIGIEKPDLIITTHHFISPSTFGKPDGIPSAVVVLDLGKPHRIWFDKRADYIIVPDQEMARWAKEKFKLPPDKVTAIGYPLKKGFKYTKNSGLTNRILILGSGIRSFLIKDWIQSIKTNFPEKKIVVVCGHNRILRRRLANTTDVETLGFVHNLHELINKSDLVITKAGPATIMEAAALKKPLILVKWVGLQERNNVDFVLENSLGIYDPNGERLIYSIAKIYKNYQNFTTKQAIQKSDTKKIIDYLLRLI